MATRLEQLNAELDTASAELQDHRLQLKAERSAATPRRDETVRLRGLIRGAESTVASIEDDIADEKAKLNSPESKARRAAARQRRDAALAGAKQVASAYQAIEQTLRQATEVAGNLTNTANKVALDATVACLAHHDGDAQTGRYAASDALAVVMGTEGHAHALAGLVDAFLRALPPSLRARVGRYVTIEHFTPITMLDATTIAQRELTHRLAGLLVDDAAAKPQSPERGRDAIVGAGPERGELPLILGAAA